MAAVVEDDDAASAQAIIVYDLLDDDPMRALAASVAWPLREDVHSAAVTTALTAAGN